MHDSQTKAASLTMTSTERLARRGVHKLLSHVTEAGITLVEEGADTHYFGDRNATLQAQLVVRHPRLYSRMLKGGSIAAAEAFMDGDWDSPDLTKVVQVMARNLVMLDNLEKKTSWMTRIGYKLSHLFNRNSKKQARDNIAAHYDLGNALYSQFLDDNMLYSSGIYQHDADTLSDAQINKMQRLCQQLHLQPDDHVLEIGTGWGALAIYIAKHYGCRVTTTTLSQEQYDWAKRRVEEENLGDRITLLLEDYRDLTGTYDKLVSVEMIEAVGKEYLDTYIKKCESLLTPNGLMAIQAITIADQRYDHYSNRVDFIQKYIFPGGFLPSITKLSETLTQRSDLVIRDVKDIGIDYARTLSDWHQAFSSNVDEVLRLGYDERFVRMWRYYLSYCEGGFLERTISTVQIVASRPQWR
ncbi:SAM-dependent methyltransferase [Thaumasiovibrio subtropicus]|uniref:SAM-dependent methyltransferase n=1 Tax=Thaumasiovibrio subtropicus TaxID=1891207 RepID=UPI000B35132D|nr:cyclopropane-fatty-acyl-phospholipid synthase family protein [Thaumasiovibrio subtropicus]